MECQPRQIAVVQGAKSTIVQQLFREFVARNRAEIRIVGLIERSSDEAAPCSAGQLHSIANDQSFPIFQELGKDSVACALDATGVIKATQAVCGDIASGCDLVVLSKFGKLEAESRSGLIPAFIAAMEAGIPILTSVSPKYADAWERFAAPLFGLLSAEADAIDHWWKTISVGSNT